jgi:chromosome segregation ATPase
MPTKDSTKAQIEKLTKELNLARGSLRDKDTRIENLEERLASKNEEIARVRGVLDGMRTPVKENIKLKEALAALQAVFNREGREHAETERDYREKINNLNRSLDTLAKVYDSANQECDRLKTQNGALRTALKEVL